MTAEGEEPARAMMTSVEMHDGRVITREDAAEFLNLVLGTPLSAHEKTDLVADLR